MKVKAESKRKPTSSAQCFRCQMFALKEVVGMKVKAESKRKPTSSAQCFRCQMYGHVQYRCTAAHKCVRCAEGHPSRECPLKGKINITPKCAKKKEGKKSTRPKEERIRATLRR
ncbi:hypothetical protein QE152_g27026 [Popillia japonica]|uniref:Nucleic-acid-binding protein from transposon X-element n=1 Tax=Popillia japonica TaxID=7064 RepID=A0AAW1JWX8_POPJA